MLLICLGADLELVCFIAKAHRFDTSSLTFGNDFPQTIDPQTSETEQSRDYDSPLVGSRGD